MKIIWNCLLFIVLFVSVNAKPFTIAEKTIEIPSPKGFAIVTPQMGDLNRFSLQLVDPANDQLAYYITESDVPAAISGKTPSLDRYCVLKVSKRLKTMVLDLNDFTKIKNAVKQQNKQILKSIEAKIPSLMEQTNKGVSKEFGVDFAIKVSQMVPLDMHHATDNTFAYSMYLNYGVAAENYKEDFIVSATATVINISGKILFLNCYGTQEDLEWTRSASKAWAKMIIENNIQLSSKD